MLGTFQPKKRQRKKVHGFRQRMKPMLYMSEKTSTKKVSNYAVIWNNSSGQANRSKTKARIKTCVQTGRAA